MVIVFINSPIEKSYLSLLSEGGGGVSEIFFMSLSETSMVSDGIFIDVQMYVHFAFWRMKVQVPAQAGAA